MVFFVQKCRFLIVYMVLYVIFAPVVQAQTIGTKNQVPAISSSNIKRVTDLSEERTAGSSEGGTALGGINGGFGQNQQGVGPIRSSDQGIKVHVLGDVSNPGIYRIGVSDRVTDVISQAGPRRGSYRLIKIKHNDGSAKFYDLYQYYYYGNLNQNPYMIDNDVVTLVESRGAVRVEGPVSRPGVFEIYYEKNLGDVIKLAGGFTGAMAADAPIKVIRFSGNGQKDILEVYQDKGQFKKFAIKKGDIVIVPDVVNMDKKFDYSVESIPGENIVYPTSVPDVFVIGSVAVPGPFPYKSHLTIKEYIGFAGAGASSNLHSVTVFRNGKKKRYKLGDKVYAGDVIIVKDRGFETFLKYVGIASTLMSVTLTALVLRSELK